MELFTQRLRLRSCRKEDLKPLAAAIAPAAVSDWLCKLPSPYTLADARNFMRRTAALEKGSKAPPCAATRYWQPSGGDRLLDKKPADRQNDLQQRFSRS